MKVQTTWLKAYLGRYSDNQEPLLSCICSVVDDLTPGKVGVSVKHLQWLGVTCNRKPKLSSLYYPTIFWHEGVEFSMWCLKWSYPPCSSDKHMRRWQELRCSPKSISRISHLPSLCETSSCSSSRCWKSEESYQLWNRTKDKLIMFYTYFFTFISMECQWTCSLPFNAMTLLAGFMMAESADIGLRIGLELSFISMMITWAVSPTFSRTQMNLSDSIVRVLNPMFAALIPTFWSYEQNKQKNFIFLFTSTNIIKIFSNRY